MPLYLYRSNRTERLVQVLCANLANHADDSHAEFIDDPFVEIPIVTGSRGMQRWIKHQVATERGVAARLAFPFPQPALDGAAAALLDDPDKMTPFWRRNAAKDPWSVGTLTWRLLPIIRRRIAADDPGRVFQSVRRYLVREGEKQSRAFSSRELAFADEVATVLDGVLRQRPETAVRWFDKGNDARLPANERWLATLLRDVRDELPPGTRHAADRFARLFDLIKPFDHAAGDPQLAEVQGSLHIFGLSTLPLQEVRLLGLISRAPGLHVHLYMLAPSRVGLEDQRSRGELVATLRRIDTRLQVSDDVGADDTRTVQSLLNQQRGLIDAHQLVNPLLGDLGRPSRDVQALLDVHAGYVEPYEVDGTLFRESQSQSLLHRLQRDILDARSFRVDGDDDERERGIRPDDTSLTFHPCFGPLRQVEELRQVLLQAFAEDRTLQPRDVLVMTPDITTYAPLVSAVFGRESIGNERTYQPSSGPAKKVTKLPSMPVEIADLGLRATNSVADVLLTVLELATERVTLSAVLGLLALEPVRRRFGLDIDDVAEARRILEGSGFRWGIDADDRFQAWKQPKLDQNTLSFALERAALGALFLDETDIDDSYADGPQGQFRVMQAPGNAGGGVARGFVPFDATDGHSLTVFGKVNALVLALLHHRQAVKNAANLADWRHRFRAILADMSATSDAAAWLTGRVLAEIDALVDDAKTAGLVTTPAASDKAPENDNPRPDNARNSQDTKTSKNAATADAEVQLDAVRGLLQGRFDLSRGGGRPITGAVTVCALEPMRSVPFKVVALLGMDDGAFPRASRYRAWDPLGSCRKAGEHDRRDIDRHLLLEALLSARDKVVVLWNGFDVHTGEEMPAAVPVRELMDAVDTRLDPIVVKPGDPPQTTTASQFLTLAGSLQPWSTKAFETPRKRVQRAPSYDVRMLSAARNLFAARIDDKALSATIQAGDLGRLASGTDAEAESNTVHVDTLSPALENPARLLMKTRFKLRVPRKPEDSPDREPLDMNNLERWSVRNMALTALVNGGGAEVESQVASRLRAEGSLPIGDYGRLIADDAVEEAGGIVSALQDVIGATGGEPLNESIKTHDVGAVLDLDGETWALHAGDVGFAVDPKNEAWDMVTYAVPSSESPKYVLRCWLRLLATVVSRADNGERPLSGAALVVKGGQRGRSIWLNAPAADDARAHATRLVEIFRTAHSVQTPLFPKTSAEIAKMLARMGRPWDQLSPHERMEIRGKIDEKWDPAGDNAFGDGDDEWIEAVWGSPDFDSLMPEPTEEQPVPPIVELAIAVYEPIAAARHMGKKPRPTPPDPPAPPDPPTLSEPPILSDPPTLSTASARQPSEGTP